MKKVLIMVVSSQNEPYEQMYRTSLSTWDKVNVNGIETVYYFAQPKRQNTEREIYFDLPERYSTMGEKMIMAFEWALENKEFDYIARVNASTYVDKRRLIYAIQDLPDENVFSCLEVAASNEREKWSWGCFFMLSKDVVKKVVDNKELWNHSEMEDVAIGHLMNNINVPYMPVKGCSIENMIDNWRCVSYGAESITFTNFSEVKRLGHYFYRVKQDGARWMDAFVMNELFNNLT